MATAQFHVLIEDLDRFVNQLVAKLALDIHANLVLPPGEGGTPIDTGWARANWIPRVAEPVLAPHGKRPTKKGAKFTDLSAQQAGEASVQRGYKIDLGPIYISNVVPYINELNNGSSRQAARGFVQAAIVKAIVEDSRK